MPSIAEHHFPIIRWQDGVKHLWNPVHRKVLKNRPEERVRLRIIEYLIGAGWSRYRITTEEAVKNHGEYQGLRTDVICYNQDFEPSILIECKAEKVPLSGSTAEQIARYNRNVQAPYLLLSNGYRDYWYFVDLTNNRVRSLSDVPDLLNTADVDHQRDFDYWKKRGFAGNRAIPGLRGWLEKVLNCFARPQIDKTYLQFKSSPEDLDLNHYYHVMDRGDYRLACTFVATPYGGSRIAGIINQAGKNRAVIEVNLDLLFQYEQPNATVYTEEGISNTDLRAQLDRDINDPSDTDLGSIPDALASVFEEMSGRAR